MSPVRESMSILDRSRLRSDGARVDVALTLFAVVIGVGGTALAAAHQSGVRHLDVVGYLLLLAGAVCLLPRRRWPVGVFGVAFASTLAYDVSNYPGGPIWAPLVIAFITLLVTGHRLVAYASLPVGYGCFVWLTYLVGDRPLPSFWAVAGIAAWLLFLPAVAEMVRNRRAYRRENALREIQERRSLEEEARRQASEQRLGIARELHDVLAHSISLINVQAGVALELMDGRPEQARVSLTAIKQASKDALVEVQSVLGALRQPGEPAPRAPSASLLNIDELVHRARAAGLHADLHSTGDLATLPAAVDATGFRIVQEALTNVVRHAGAASMSIELCREPSALTITVDDDGSERTDAGVGPGVRTGGGTGIAGMRERAAALGGQVHAGPKGGGGGFRVQARLPCTGNDRTPA